MRSLAKISVVAMVGLGLGRVPTVWGQGATKPPVAIRSNTGPTQGTSDSVAAPLNGEYSKPSTPVVDRTDSSSATTATKADERKPVGGGYSWSDKKSRPRKAKRPAVLDPKRALAQAPSFELRPNGSSVVTLLLSHRTEVERVSERHRVEYRLKDAQIGVSNNMNPLITAHFATPVQRVVLRRHKDGAVLILELRENVQPTHQIRSGPAGSTMLEVTLPGPSHAYPAPQTQPQVRQSMAKAARSDTEPKQQRRTAKRPAPQAGPGPRL